MTIILKADDAVGRLLRLQLDTNLNDYLFSFRHFRVAIVLHPGNDVARTTKYTSHFQRRHKCQISAAEVGKAKVIPFKIKRKIKI